MVKNRKINYLLCFSFISSLVLMINSTKIGDNDGNRKRYDKNSAQRAKTSDYFTGHSVWRHITITETRQEDKNMAMDKRFHGSRYCSIVSAYGGVGRGRGRGKEEEGWNRITSERKRKVKAQRLVEWSFTPFSTTSAIQWRQLTYTWVTIYQPFCRKFFSRFFYI